MGLIRECLGTEAAIPAQPSTYDDALGMARKSRPSVVIVGFDNNAEHAIRLGPQLANELPGVTLVALSERTDPERIRAAMRSGFREFLVLPEDGNLLRKAVREAASADVEDVHSGQVIALVGSKGGCGVTSLAINLAAEISQIEQVCVLDLDFSMGDVAAFLDLQPSSSIQDLLRNLSRLDERMLRGSVAVHPSKVHVLAQPSELPGSGDVKGDDILRVLSVAADAYKYVILDCGGRIDEATLTASSVADLVFIISTPDVPAVKNAWRRLQLMDRLGLDRSAVRLIINKWERTSELSQADIETNLGVPVAATISYDPVTCRKAVNAGRLLRDIDRRSQTAKDISDAVTLVTEGATRVERKSANTPFFRFFK
jgi:pilus assembly protein CpaE